MSENSGINWDEAEKETQQRTDKRGRKYTSRVYQKRTCPNCGRTISESAYSGSDGNWVRHSKACMRDR